MGKIIVFHVGCGGPAIEDENIYPDQTLSFLNDEEFTLTCFICLEEIVERKELTLAEMNPQ